MPRDYYIVLGIDRGADPARIKHAYRNAIKRHHPDMAGRLNAKKFLEAREAYEVLSDIDKRRAYDGELSRREIPPKKISGLTTPKHIAFVLSGRAANCFRKDSIKGNRGGVNALIDTTGEV